MRPPLTNTALLAAVVLATVTGVLAYGVGTPGGRVVVVVHGVAGLALLVLTPHKSRIVRRGWTRRGRSGRAGSGRGRSGHAGSGRAGSGRAASAWLAGLVALTVGTGIAHSVGQRDLGPVTTLQVHVAAAAALTPLLALHLLTRPRQVRAVDPDRRTLLRAGGVMALAGLAWGTVEGLLRVAGARGADRRFTGSHEIGSYAPSAMPVTQWFDDRPPTSRVRSAPWRLQVADRAGERTLSLDELRGHPGRREVVATLDCTGGWYAEQRWRGVPLGALVDGDGARSVVVRSTTGYARRFPVRDLPRLLLADGAGGAPLSVGHGAPARLVAPGRRGFWWIKWVARIETSTRPWWLQSPFPLT